MVWIGRVLHGNLVPPHQPPSQWLPDPSTVTLLVWMLQNAEPEGAAWLCLIFLVFSLKAAHYQGVQNKQSLGIWNN